MATKRRLHITKANAQNGARKEFWPEFRKVETIRARYIGGAFTVETREGVLDMPDGGWLALDRDGYPYPIATDVFARIYEEVSDAPARWAGGAGRRVPSSAARNHNPGTEPDGRSAAPISEEGSEA